MWFSSVRNTLPRLSLIRRSPGDVFPLSYGVRLEITKELYHRVPVLERKCPEKLLRVLGLARVPENGLFERSRPPVVEEVRVSVRRLSKPYAP